MMKNLLSHIFLFLSMIGLWTACSSGEETSEIELRMYATPSSLHFDGSESVLQLSLSTDARWTIACGDEWLSVDPASGEGSAKVRVTARENSLTQERSSSLKIVYGASGEMIVPVAQSAVKQNEVPLFDTPEALKSYLTARIAACNYAESVSVSGDIVKFSFIDAGTHGVRNVPLFTLNDGGYWVADGAMISAKADTEALKAGVPPPRRSDCSG